VAIDRLPSGSFRARLMMDGQRYTSSFPTEADAGRWEVEVRAAAVRRRSVASVTFGVYAEDWLAGFIDDAPDRAGSRRRSSVGCYRRLGSWRSPRCWNRTAAR
jgi:hypothetical protein